MEGFEGVVGDGWSYWDGGLPFSDFSGFLLHFYFPSLLLKRSSDRYGLAYEQYTIDFLLHLLSPLLFVFSFFVDI